MNITPKKDENSVALTPLLSPFKTNLFCGHPPWTPPRAPPLSPPKVLPEVLDPKNKVKQYSFLAMCTYTEKLDEQGTIRQVVTCLLTTRHMANLQVVT